MCCLRRLILAALFSLFNANWNYVSDERLRAFQKLTPEQRLRWVEELATFLKLAKIGSKQAQKESNRSYT
jgi:hypothetical protein